MELEIMLSEVTQFQKDKSTGFLSYVHDRSKRHTNIYIYIYHTHTHTHTERERERERELERKHASNGGAV
jgi:hypothetical protein